MQVSRGIGSDEGSPWPSRVRDSEDGFPLIIQCAWSLEPEKPRRKRVSGDLDRNRSLNPLAGSINPSRSLGGPSRRATIIGIIDSSTLVRVSSRYRTRDKG